jgi:hypothetical protein
MNELIILVLVCALALFGIVGKHHEEHIAWHHTHPQATVCPWLTIEEAKGK